MDNTTVHAESDAAHAPASVAGPAGAAAGRLVHKLAIMASGTAATVVLSLLQSVVIARLLGPSQLGQYATTMAAILILAQLNDFGLANAFAYYARHRPGTIRPLLRILQQHVGLCVCIAAGAVMLGSVLGWRDVLSPWWFAATVICATTVGTPNLVVPVLLLARSEYRAYTMFVNGTSMLYVIVVLVVGVTYGPTWRGFILASVIVQGIIVLLEVRFLLARAEPGVETITRWECYRYGLQMKWAEVMKLLGTRADLIILAGVLPSSQVGQYSLALGFREAGMLPLRTYSAILQNMIVDRQKAGSDDRFLVLAALAMQVCVSLITWGGVAAILAWAVPFLYGDAYTAIVGPAAVLFGSTLFLSVAGVCFIVFNMAGRPSLSAAVVTAGGIAGPPLVWMLSQHFGLYGAAYAALASTMITALLGVIVLIRLRGLAPSDMQHVAVHLPSVMRQLVVGGVRSLPRFARRSEFPPRR